MKTWRVAGAVVLTLAGTLPARPAAAQTPAAPFHPAGPAPVAPPRAMPGPPAEPVLTRHPTNHRDWTVLVDVRLHGTQVQTPPGTRNLYPTQRILLDSVTVFFPLPGGSSSAETWDDRTVGTLSVGGRVVADRPRVLDGYQSLARLGAWDLTKVDANMIHLRLERSMTSWETRIDETRSAKIGWPAGAWPEPIDACLRPQLLIESDSAAVKNLLERWMRQAPGGSDPRRTAPYVLAKYLAGRVVAHYQPSAGAIDSSGRGRNSLRYSGALLSGFAVDGAARAAERGRGPELDMANLLVAVWRAAGIPARLVIGYDARSEDPAKSRIAAPQTSLLPKVRAWTEFYLYDETAGTGEWVPVDVQRQREFASRPPPLEQRWLYFGHHEDLDLMQPLSFHWLPPTPCMNIGPPALWGWVPAPENVLADPDVRISVKAASRRGDDPARSTTAPGGGPGPQRK